VRLGIGSYTYTWAIGVPGHTPPNPMSHLDLLERARELDAGVVQYCDNLPLTSLNRSEMDILAGRAADYGIEIEIGARGIGHENIADHLALAKRFKAKFVRFVIDQGHDEPSPAEVVDRVKPSMAAFADAGIIFAIENHDRFPVAELAGMIEALGAEHAGICLDTVNSFVSLEMPKEVVGMLAPYTVNLHVKDFQIKRIPSQMGFQVTGCAAGSGRLDIPWVLDELKAAGRDVNAIIELWTPFAGSLKETIAREQEWAEESVRYMRQIATDHVTGETKTE